MDLLISSVTVAHVFGDNYHTIHKLLNMSCVVPTAIDTARC
jgi:uncharacterized Rossmann fold enzyme